MSAKIVTITNQKGGVGKTNIAINLAEAAASRGFRTLLMDADPQGSAVAYLSRLSDDQTTPPVRIVGVADAGKKVHTAIRGEYESYDLIIVDTPPHKNVPQPHSAMLVSDLVLVPMTPSAVDLEATLATLDQIESVQTVNEELAAAIVISRISRGRRLSDAIPELLEGAPIPVLKARVGEFEAFKTAALDGRGILGMRRSSTGDARRQLDIFVDEVLTLLGLPMYQWEAA